MTAPADHRRLFEGFSSVLNRHAWDRLGQYFEADAVMVYPQSQERFSGLANIQAQYELYPNLGTDMTEVEDVVGGTTYALTPMYTIVGIEGTGDRGTAVIRVRYPNETRWWAILLYELRDGRMSRARVFFAPEFEAPEWRAPFRGS